MARSEANIVADVLKQQKLLKKCLIQIGNYCKAVRRERVDFETFDIQVLYEAVDMIIVEAQKMDKIGDRLANLHEEEEERDGK